MELSFKEFEILANRLFLCEFFNKPDTFESDEEKFEIRIPTGVAKDTIIYVKYDAETGKIYTEGKFINSREHINDLRHAELHSMDFRGYYDYKHPPLLTVDELIAKLEADEMVIETKGHNAGKNGCTKYAKKDIKETILDYFEESRKRVTPEFWNDSKSLKGKTPEELASSIETGKRLAEIYTNYFIEPLKKNVAFGAVSDSKEIQCHNCGDRLQILLKDVNTITLGDSFSDKTEGRENVPCILSDGLKPKEAIIDMPSGDIVIANYFIIEGERDNRNIDTPYGMKEGRYSDYSVQYHSTRNNLMQKMASRGIGYGQMGNMDLAVYVNKTKDKIIIGDSHPINDYEDEEGDKINPDYLQAIEDGYKCCGSISLSLWAYYLVDKQNMEKYNTEVISSKDVINSDDVEEGNLSLEYLDTPYYERIICNVQSGKWKLTHYYDNTRDPKDYALFTYATLELIKE